MEQSDVLLRNFWGATNSENWIQVIGGALRREGKNAPGQVSIFSGATCTSRAPYAVEKGGRLTVRSVYHEITQGDIHQAIVLKDSGVLSIDTTEFGYKTDATQPLIVCDGFRGNFTLTCALLFPVDSKPFPRFLVSGDGAATNMLCLGSLLWINDTGVSTDKVWTNEARPAAKAALLYSNMNTSIKGALQEKDGAFGELENKGEQRDRAGDDFIRKMLTPLRQARIWLPDDEGKPGRTNVGIHRVWIITGKGGRGVELLAGK